MYPIERVLKNMKGYVWNMCKLEGNMEEGYIFDEALGLYTRYMERFGATWRRVWDVNEEEGVASVECRSFLPCMYHFPHRSKGRKGLI
jgi:hypothetical protein